MYQLNHVLVTLDLSDMDDSLIRYTNFLVDKIKPDSVTFLHVLRPYEIPKDIIEAFPHLDEPVADVIREGLQEKIDDLFTPESDVKTTIKVQEGYPTETIVKFTQKND